MVPRIHHKERLRTMSVSSLSLSDSLFAALVRPLPLVDFDRDIPQSGLCRFSLTMARFLWRKKGIPYCSCVQLEINQW